MKRSSKSETNSDDISSCYSSKIKKLEENERPWQNISFQERLCGSDGILKPIKSLHTHRTLKPYIRQDFETEPSKLKLIREINQRTSKEPIPKFPINYTYIQAKHVGQINRLATAFFWPGIDGTFRVSRYGPYFNTLNLCLTLLFLHQLCNPQYDKRLFIDLPVQYMKTTSSEHIVYLHKLF